MRRGGGGGGYAEGGGGGQGPRRPPPPAAFERASGAAAETPLSTRFLELGAAWQSWTRHAVGGFCSPEAVDLDLGPGQVSGLQRFSSDRKTTRRGEPRRQPRNRAPHLTRRQTGFSAEAPAP